MQIGIITDSLATLPLDEMLLALRRENREDMFLEPIEALEKTVALINRTAFMKAGPGSV